MWRQAQVPAVSVIQRRHGDDVTCERHVRRLARARATLPKMHGDRRQQRLHPRHELLEIVQCDDGELPILGAKHFGISLSLASVFCTLDYLTTNGSSRI